MDKENEGMENSQNDEPKQESVYSQDKKVFKLKKISCPSCGGAVEVNKDQDFATCPFCQNKFSVKEDTDFTIDRDVLMKYSGKNPEVEVPSGVRAIGPAFQEQTTLTKVILPEGVNELRGNTFYGCTNLETVILPDSLENIPTLTFADCVSLKSINLPKNIKNIERMAFSGCKNLTSIKLPPSVESVESDAFFQCERLETITCYENTKIRGTDFRDCVNLNSIIVLDSKTGEKVSKKRVIQDDIGFFKIVDEDDNTIEDARNAVEEDANTEQYHAEDESSDSGRSLDIFRLIQIIVIIGILIYLATRFL